MRTCLSGGFSLFRGSLYIKTNTNNMKSFFVLLFSLVVAHGFCQEQSTPAVKQFLNEFVSNYEPVKKTYISNHTSIPGH